MTVNERCPKCNGRCCDYGLDPYLGAHRSEAFHICLYCTNGTKPTVGTAEQERAAVVAWLRRGDWASVLNAEKIERGEHRREEDK